MVEATKQPKPYTEKFIRWAIQQERRVGKPWTADVKEDYLTVGCGVCGRSQCRDRHNILNTK
jgi:formate dehydrogenase assembly factor FdhD